MTGPLTLVLLALLMLINFWDRAAFGFAGFPIMRDLRLSHTEFGLLGGVFFWLFSPAALLGGWLADRRPARWIIGCMALLWAIAQSLMSFASALPQAFASRLLLGAGEGPALPCALHVAYLRFPAASRAMLSAIVSLGAPLGIASGALIITLVVQRFGWRAAFAVLSLISIAWSVAWIVTQRSPASVAPPKRAHESKRPALRPHSTTFGIIIAAFCAYWILALAVNWFPVLLQVANKLPALREGQFLTGVWGLQTLIFPLTARVSQSLQRRGYSGEIALAAPAACGIAISGISLILFSRVSSSSAALAFLAISLWSAAVAFTVLPPIVAEIVPSQDRGVALGLFAGISSTAGVLAPLVFGRIVDMAGGAEHGYRLAVLTSGIFLSVAAPVAFLLMKPSRHRVTESDDWIAIPGLIGASS